MLRWLVLQEEIASSISRVFFSRTWITKTRNSEVCIVWDCSFRYLNFDGADCVIQLIFLFRVNSLRAIEGRKIVRIC